jgi:hypothetical protein
LFLVEQVVLSSFLVDKYIDKMKVDKVEVLVVSYKIELVLVLVVDIDLVVDEE